MKIIFSQKMDTDAFCISYRRHRWTRRPVRSVEMIFCDDPLIILGF